MNNELLTILNYMERERGIDKNVLVEAVEFAMQSAARKSGQFETDVRVEVDRTTYQMRVIAQRRVVETVTDSKTEIALDQAGKIQPGIAVGDMLEEEVPARGFGRIAAQTAKQAITQRIRHAERERVFGEYKSRIGDIVSGTVRQFNRSDIIIDLGRAEAVLPSRERVPTEEYQVGDRIRAYILDVKEDAQGPGVILSRSHADFIRKLFKLEVSEISDNIVEIKGIAREPGYRTKIAVVSKDEKVDPVGACVGMRGIRVKNIVRELSGEKIDIIRWSPDIKTYVTNALSPAKLAKITVDEARRTVHALCDGDQLSLAIGKRGQNVRLTAKLIGWKIDIAKTDADSTFEEKVARAVDNLACLESVSHDQAQKLVEAGFLSAEGIVAADVQDLVEMAGLTEVEARAIHDSAASMHPGTDED